MFQLFLKSFFLNFFPEIIFSFFLIFYFKLKKWICKTDIWNPTKLLNKTTYATEILNRNKESFIPMVACVNWPDLSPGL